MKFPFLFKSPETTACAAASWPWTSCATNPKTPSFRANADDDKFPETSIRGLRSERFFFEPGRTNSILEEAKPDCKRSAAATVEMDSEDPFRDFRVSMEEMVEAHALKDDWGNLEELLACYLRVNVKSNHVYIIGAFVDLLLHLSGGGVDENCSLSSPITTTTTTTATYSSSSSTSFFCNVSCSPGV